MSVVDPTKNMTALPSVMRAKLDEARQHAAEPAPATPAQPATPAEPAASTEPAAPATPAEPERITLTREELNELRAQAEKTKVAEGRSEAAQLRIAEMQHRLTELEKVAKSDPIPEKPAIDTAAIQFSEEEEKEFADSKEFIAKVARMEVAKAINAMMPTIQKRIDEVDTTSRTVATQFAKSRQTTFFERLVEKLGAAPQEIAKHKHWADFLDGTEPNSGMTYEKLLGHHVANENLQSAVHIYNTFVEKYVGKKADTSAFAGANPSSTAISSETTPKGEKFAYSKRKKASEDYRFQRISYDKLQEIDAEFKKAEKDDNVDYNK